MSLAAPCDNCRLLEMCKYHAWLTSCWSDLLKGLEGCTKKVRVLVYFDCKYFEMRDE